MFYGKQFAIIQARLTDAANTVDTCGVLYLHGLPGILGGSASHFVVGGINVGAQLSGILVTVVIAASTGLASGKVIIVLGRRMVPYVDSEEFEGEEIEEEDMELQTVIASEDGVA